MVNKQKKTALDAVMEEPWAITQEGLRTILAIAGREGDLDALQRKLEGLAAVEGQPLPASPSVELRGGVAVISARGPSFRYANLLTQFSGAHSLEMLAKEFRAAADDPAVHSILFAPDSPGGQVSGVNEFANLIRDIDQQKPVFSYVGNLSASANYWALCASREIIIDATAQLGSIGVVATFVDNSKQMAEQGLEEIEIVSSASPHKRPDPKTEEGRALMQDRVDALAAIFVSRVAHFRGVDEAKVLADFGRGGVLIGEQAVAAGMADRIGSFEGLIDELNSKHGGEGFGSFSAHHKKGVFAMTLEEMQAKYPQQCQALADQARQEGHQAGLAEGLEQGAENERKRIQGVESATMPGHEALIAQLKFDGKTTAGDAALAVNQAEKKKLEGIATNLEKDAPKAPAASEPEDTQTEAQEEEAAVAGLLAGIKNR